MSNHKNVPAQYRVGSVGEPGYDYKKIFIVSVILLSILLIINIKQKIEIAEKFKKNQDISKEILSLKQENTIFRTVTPVSSSVPDLIKYAEKDKLLVPGWVTRIYPTTMKNDDLSASMDLGSFIMNGTSFTLTNHKNYGIETPEQALYQMSGLYTSNVRGKHQIAVKGKLLLPNSLVQYEKNYTAKCKVSVFINNKTIINSKIELTSKYNPTQIIVGEIELEKGIFPISNKIYCDKTDGINGSNTLFSINFRNPEQFSFHNNGLSIYHIYSLNKEEMDSRY